MPRPKKQLPRNGLQIIRDMAAAGNREIDIARALGMSYDTYHRIKGEFPPAAEALEEGRGIEHQALVGSLFDAAMKGNVVAAMFLLKTRHGYREGYMVEHNSTVNVRFEMPGALPVTQYEKLIEHE